jgi:hypothetical protein
MCELFCLFILILSCIHPPTSKPRIELKLSNFLCYRMANVSSLVLLEAGTGKVGMSYIIYINISHFSLVNNKYAMYMWGFNRDVSISHNFNEASLQNNSVIFFKNISTKRNIYSEFCDFIHQDKRVKEKKKKSTGWFSELKNLSFIFKSELKN